jgi:hypothetical protein
MRAGGYGRTAVYNLPGDAFGFGDDAIIRVLCNACFEKIKINAR